MGAYVDVMAHLAEVDPMTFLLAMTCAEGLPGTRKTLPAELATALVDTAPGLGEHVNLDANMNHGLMARRLTRDAGMVSAPAGRRAIGRFHQILILSQRSWRQAAAAATGHGLAPPFTASMERLVLDLGASHNAGAAPPHRPVAAG